MSKLRVNHRIAQGGQALVRGRWRRVMAAAARGNFGVVLLISRFLRRIKAQTGNVVKFRVLFAAVAAALLAVMSGVAGPPPARAAMAIPALNGTSFTVNNGVSGTAAAQAGTVNGLPPWFIRNGQGGNEWLPVQHPQPQRAISYEIYPPGGDAAHHQPAGGLVRQRQQRPGRRYARERPAEPGQAGRRHLLPELRL
jgi:hypothetical protein